jgi:hypothetical protein
VRKTWTKPSLSWLSIEMVVLFSDCCRLRLNMAEFILPPTSKTFLLFFVRYEYHLQVLNNP